MAQSDRTGGRSTITRPCFLALALVSGHKLRVEVPVTASFVSLSFFKVCVKVAVISTGAEPFFWMNQTQFHGPFSMIWGAAACLACRSRWFLHLTNCRLRAIRFDICISPEIVAPLLRAIIRGGVHIMSSTKSKCGWFCWKTNKVVSFLGSLSASGSASRCSLSYCCRLWNCFWKVVGCWDISE